MRQISFKFFRNYKKTFGGSELLGRRKTARPLSTTAPIHLILKSETRKIFRPNNQSLQNLILNTAQKFNVQICEYALNWSHIHFIIRIKDRQDYVRFIRALTSKLAMAVSRSTSVNQSTSKIAGQGETVQSTDIQKTQYEKLFTLRPFTRILNWGRDYQSTVIYIFKNFKQSLGFRKTDRTEKHHPSTNARRSKNRISNAWA